MIDVARAGRVLIVSEGPGPVMRAATLVWPALGLVVPFVTEWVPVHALRALSPLVLHTAGGAMGLAVTLLWLRGWRTTSHRFDRDAGKLSIVESGPVRRRVARELPLSAVTAVFDRRSDEAHAVELVLADASTLVVARSEPTSDLLDSLARELGALLQKPVRLARGTVVDQRFELERVVDEGGMGVLYRARDRQTGEPVALKLCSIAGETGQQRQRFQRETGLLATFHHPRIVGYVAHGEAADGSAYLAMKWLEGEDLRTTLERGPLPLDDCMAMLRGAAEALAEVHAHGVVHRALEPANLFFCGRSAASLTLLDFGVARRIDGTMRLPGSRSVLGTPRYMAPEQASSALDVGPAADVFSLGCIFYECLTGRHPFDARQRLGVLARILFDRPEPVHTLRPGVPAAWAELLSRMLAKAPDERPGDGATLLRELSTRADAGAPSRRLGPDVLAPVLSPDPDLDDGDPVLVTVVLATAAALRAEAEDDAARLVRTRDALARFGCPILRLADGSLLATVQAQPSATDQVRIAAECALYLRELMPGARIAVATGRASRRRTLRVGEAVDRAVVLQQPALDDDAVRLDELSAELLAGRFVIARHGSLSLLAAQTPRLDERRPLLGKPTPCVGRELELIQLEALVVSGIEDGRPRAALVLGAPGIGTSRLRHELQRRAGERYPRAVQLVGHGDVLRAGSPYATLGALLRRHAGLRGGESDGAARTAIAERLCRHVATAQRARVSEFLGELCAVPFLDQDNPPLQAARRDPRVMREQLDAAFVDWLSAECAAEPVLVVLEDVQWVDALTLKLLASALRRLTHARVSVLAFGRPESEGVVAKLFSGQLSISLGALGEKASEALVRLGLGAAVEAAQVRRIVHQSAGNALFLEELIRAAAEREATDVPDTVLAMLQARLSRCSREERAFLRSASIFGERFWLGGVVHVGAHALAPSAADACLTRLVDAELVVREQVSRFVDEVEYSFRHALVGDAAYGLYTVADRQVAHAAAGRWLEQRGESDGVVLARHAEHAEERERASSFYARAAEQSLAQCDFGEALVRAHKGVACGAYGQPLGVLECVQCAAFHGMGRWVDAAALGLRALTLLRRGSTWWCATVETLLQVLPNVGRLEQSHELADQLLEVVPEPGAHAAYVRALHAQLLGCAVSGAHERGRETLESLTGLDPEVLERDLASRGSASLWRAVYTFLLTPDMERALHLSRRAIVDLTESQVSYRLSFAHILQAFIYWGLGDLEESERSARAGRALAQRLDDGYHGALAAWSLSLALSEQGDADKLAEAEQCAWELHRCADHAVFDGSSRNAAARVAVLRGDFAAAASLGNEARESLHGMAPYALLASSSVLSALAAEGRSSEAVELARRDLARLEALGGPVFSELLFRVAACDALLGAGHTAEAERVLADTHQRLSLRASMIADPTLRSSYMARPENRRLVTLLDAVRASTQPA